VQMPADFVALRRRPGPAGGFELCESDGEVGVADNVAYPSGEVAAGHMILQHCSDAVGTLDSAWSNSSSVRAAATVPSADRRV
jgi:hypothetical protein